MLMQHQELMVNSFQTYTLNLSRVMSNFDWSKLTPLCQDIYYSIGDDRQVFLCGNGGSGGKAKDLADDAIHFQCDDMQIAEDLQTICGHVIMQYDYDNIT